MRFNLNAFQVIHATKPQTSPSVAVWGTASLQRRAQRGRLCQMLVLRTQPTMFAVFQVSKKITEKYTVYPPGS